MYSIHTSFPAQGHLAEEAEEPGMEPISLVMPGVCTAIHRKYKGEIQKMSEIYILPIIKVAQCSII